MREGYITTTIPVGEGIQFKGGLFVSPLGTEILLNPGNYNDEITRSFAFYYAIPIRHLGTLFTYPILKTLSISGGLVTGWDDPHDNNGSPSFLGGVNFTPSDAFGLASNIVAGPEQRHNTNNIRFTWSNVATIKPMDPLTVYLEYTFGTEHQAPTPTGNRNAQWYAFAGCWLLGLDGPFQHGDPNGALLRRGSIEDGRLCIDHTRNQRVPRRSDVGSEPISSPKCCKRERSLGKTGPIEPSTKIGIPTRIPIRPR